MPSYNRSCAIANIRFTGFVFLITTMVILPGRLVLRLCQNALIWAKVPWKSKQVLGAAAASQTG
jgi:hypothetical protein